jgi:phosphoglucomutase
MLKSIMETSGGFIPLPTIYNSKTVDPQIDTSHKVFQLETAMGAAIECFQGAAAVQVPRSRFAPVKKCSDLFLLRSDAYVINADSVLTLNPSCHGNIPVVEMDAVKFVQHLEECTRGGYPSLIHCQKLKVVGEVYMSSRNIFKGEVTVTNTVKNDPKILPAGVYENCNLDISDYPNLGALKIYTMSTVPYLDQKPGTSGLRKKTKKFQEGFYLHNFIQSTFNALKALGVDVGEGSLLVGGDGRYYNDYAIQIIIRIAIANGVRRVIVAENGLMSTPAVSAVIRERGPTYLKCFGAFILTASHNPGGPDEDFGIKYNCENGGPAPEVMTDMIYDITKTITTIKMCCDIPVIDLSVKNHVYTIATKDGSSEVNIEVISTTAQHIELLKTIFDFPKLRQLIARPDFSMRYDCMHGVQGPYAHEVFINELGASPSSLLNSVPKTDFNGGHADPNLTYARDICEIMKVDRAGLPIAHDFANGEAAIPCFGAAADGDADRNMILGRRFFVTPSDSLAIIAAHADIIPFFQLQGGLKSVARSMPTSCAVDRVAKALNLHCFEVPTGWKFFGNIMDSKVPNYCLHIY